MLTSTSVITTVGLVGWFGYTYSLIQYEKQRKQQNEQFKGEHDELKLLQLMKELDRRKTFQVDPKRESAGLSLSRAAAQYLEPKRTLSHSTSTQLKYYHDKFLNYNTAAKIRRNYPNVLGGCANMPATYVNPATPTYEYTGSCMAMCAYFLKEHIKGGDPVKIIEPFRQGYPSHFPAVNQTMFQITVPLKVKSSTSLQFLNICPGLYRRGLGPVSYSLFITDVSVIRDKNKLIPQLVALNPGAYFIVSASSSFSSHATALIVNEDKSMIFFDPNFGVVHLSAKEVNSKLYSLLEAQLSFHRIINICVTEVGKNKLWSMGLDKEIPLVVDTDKRPFFAECIEDLRRKWRALVQGRDIPATSAAPGDAVPPPAQQAHEQQEQQESLPLSEEECRRQVDQLIASGGGVLSWWFGL